MSTRTRTCSVLAAVAAAAGTFVSSALATSMAGGATLEPIPAAALPAGATQVYTLTKDFSYMTTRYINTPNGPIPIIAPVSGSITQRVYRLADNTISFAYSIGNDSNSQNEPTEFSVRDFSDYSADVFQWNGIVNILVTQSCNRAIRSNDGGNIEFDIDSGLTAGKVTNTVYVRTNATAYRTAGRYTITASRVTVCTGGVCQNVYGFAYPTDDATPPIVSLAAPAQLADVCNPVAITGTAYDPEGFDERVLEYSSNPNGPWVLISSSSTPVASTASLGSWNTTPISQGYYFIRLTATNTTGMSSSVTSMVYVDKQFDTVDLRSPGNTQILGGGVCFDGTVNDGNGVNSNISYTISYAPLPAGSPFLPVDPAHATYTPGVINDGLGAWQTASGPAAVPDGNYRVRVTGTDHCGNSKTVTRDLVIDNTAPIATITSPAPCSNVSGLVTISGTASDAHMAGWVLQYSGGDAHTWVTIASGNSSITAGTLGAWNTAGLRPCAYTLRLVAGDAAGVNCSGNNNQAEYHLSVNVGCPGDFNRNGSTTVQDLFDYLAAYFAACP